MLAGLTSRQLSEIYAFAAIEPLDQPLQNMIAQLTDVLARVHGNDTTHEDFLLVRRVQSAIDDAKQRSQQLLEMFQAAARQNDTAAHAA
ncbi:hypothetical protein NB717_000036 [Xanthomonas sacchari]|uniref:phage tail assembly protein T n=1 Tax=Xanthomonas sacchari TaxID=56458 RepID=UPI00225E691C|nr:hypothetical protein [Xanthomonas sacchari]MCW0458968.1 hypothetical protein [Xanthomonas sacchari]